MILDKIRAAGGALWRESTALRAWRHRASYPGLGVSPHARIDIEGSFSYGGGCGIADHAVIMVSNGASLRFGEGVQLGRNTEIGATGDMQIGDGTTLQDRTLLVGSVRVGRYCLFSLNVLATSGRHYFELEPETYIRDQDALVFSQPDLAAQHDRPVVIDDDCWIGANAFIMSGVRIGKGCVVGAGAVVTTDLPPYSVAVGSPARIIRRRLDFRPPRDIRFDRRGDAPYFYAGVGLSNRERAAGEGHGGLLAASRFTLALDVPAGAMVVLEASGVVAGTIVRHGGQRMPLDVAFAEVEFRAEPEDDGRLQFEVDGGVGRWPVHLRSAGRK